MFYFFFALSILKKNCKHPFGGYPHFRKTPLVLCPQEDQVLDKKTHAKRGSGG